VGTLGDSRVKATLSVAQSANVPEEVCQMRLCPPFDEIGVDNTTLVKKNEACNRRHDAKGEDESPLAIVECTDCVVHELSKRRSTLWNSTGQ
jgi:hypothetical protein